MADTMKDRKLQSMMAALASSAEALFKLTFKEWCEPRPPQPPSCPRYGRRCINEFWCH